MQRSRQDAKPPSELLVKTNGRTTTDTENCDSGSSAQIKDQVEDWRANTPAETGTMVTRDDNDNISFREDSSSPSPLSLKVHLRRSSSPTSCTMDDLSTSQQSSGVDCADIVLNCLFCQVCDLICNIPQSCERLINQCCPNVQHLITTVEAADDEDSDSLMAIDCGLFTSCHDASDCLELAMEISELCYH